MELRRLDRRRVETPTKVVSRVVYVSDTATKRFDSDFLKSISSETISKEEKKDRFFTVSSSKIQKTNVKLPKALESKVNEVNQKLNNIRLTPAGLLIASGDIESLRNIYEPIQVTDVDIDPEEVDPTSAGWKVINSGDVQVPSESRPTFDGKSSLILRPEERPYIVAIIEEGVNKDKNPTSLSLVIRKVKSQRFTVKNYFLLRKSILTQYKFFPGQEIKENNELLEKYKVVLTNNFKFNLKDLMIVNVKIKKNRIYAYKILVNYEQRIVEDKVELVSNVDQKAPSLFQDSFDLQVSPLSDDDNDDPREDLERFEDFDVPVSNVAEPEEDDDDEEEDQPTSRKAKRKVRRKKRQTKRKDRREKRQTKRKERRSDRQDKRKERRSGRKEKRQDRKEKRQDRRKDRRSDRKDKRKDRRSKRKSRRRRRRG